MKRDLSVIKQVPVITTSFSLPFRLLERLTITKPAVKLTP